MTTTTNVIQARISPRMKELLKQLKGQIHGAAEIIVKINEQGKRDSLSKDQIRDLINLAIGEIMSSRQIRRLLPLELKYSEKIRNEKSISADIMTAKSHEQEPIKSTELPQELKDYAGVTASTDNKSKFVELTGLKSQPRQGRDGLLEGQISIPHAEWDPEDGLWSKCPKCKEQGYSYEGQPDKNGIYEIDWRHPDLKHYEWVICKIGTDVKGQQQQTQSQESESVQIESKNYDVNDLEKYDKNMLIRIVQYLHAKLQSKLNNLSRRQQQKRQQQVESALPETVRGGKYMRYEQASNYARLQKITSREQWRKHVKSKSDSFPPNIPKRPDHIYANEWNGWGAFFGKIK